MGVHHGVSTRRYKADRARFRQACAQTNRPCWLCGQPIDYTLPWQDPTTGTINDDAFELDHLYPRSTHPDLAEDPGNYRPSHRACNRARSNHMPTPGIGATTRHWTLP